MSVREDQENKNCPGRGLGIAAAAIGVGVGAALYYFFSKRTENPGEGASSSEWAHQQSQALEREKERKAREAIRQQAFADRPWTDEQCSICFDGMRRGQAVVALPCTHRFHEECIAPWLREKQTCPYCRKDA